MNMPLWLIGLTFFCALLGSIGQLMFKLGASSIGSSLGSWFNLYVLTGLIAHGVAALLLILALRHGKLSILYPILATSYIWVALFSTKFLNEPLSLTQWVGISVILIGVYLITKG